jgi:hypothetical protein
MTGTQIVAIVFIVLFLIESIDNFRLRRQHQRDKGLITSTGKINYQLLQEYDKLKTTLTEIKYIAEVAGNSQYLTFPDFNLKQNAKMLMGQFNRCLQQILQKISEVEND